MVKVRAYNNCGYSLYSTTTVYFPASPQISGQSDVCPNTTYYYDAPYNGSNYSWYANGVQITGSTTGQYVSVLTGNAYTYGYLQVEYTDVCGNRQAAYKNINVSGYCYSTFTVYPNPSTEYFEVENLSTEEGAEGEEFEIKLYNSLNKAVKEGKTKKKKIKFDVRDLPKGVYYLHIITNGKVEKRQQVIQ
ncbi:hypothetical protein BH24BAC1_BH24BAC1_13890 [soil metagenome]